MSCVTLKWTALYDYVPMFLLEMGLGVGRVVGFLGGCKTFQIRRDYF